MPYFYCTWVEGDNMYVEEKFDSSGDLCITVNENNENSQMCLSKEDAKKLAEHIIHLLEESK